MKKLLAILGVISLVTTSSINVVSCHQKESSNKIDLKTIIKTTDLGKIPNEDINNIINLLCAKNPYLDATQIKIQHLAENSAVILANDNSWKYFGKVNITFEVAHAVDITSVTLPQETIKILVSNQQKVSAGELNKINTEPILLQDIIKAIDTQLEVNVTNNDFIVTNNAQSGDYSNPQTIEITVTSATTSFLIKGAFIFTAQLSTTTQQTDISGITKLKTPSYFGVSNPSEVFAEDIRQLLDPIITAAVQNIKSTLTSRDFTYTLTVKWDGRYYWPGHHWWDQYLDLSSKSKTIQVQIKGTGNATGETPNINVTLPKAVKK
ncbi:spiralin repeat-containing protein [Spiroplasma eriocheiris]|uniref:Spiralin n=1 Tax=Spiroplasma eriocheiris TaxID=315358 RepID=A0A0H3XL53_9MOLU|nr:spiralin repeat-containing protein [Spiroplasma eriocheiris]AHF57743.1 spiralin [Spiroplasma eriocheiris CCTCC M 207170]AKM54194.1 hypothetical protein SERIO_v1c06230 [Spiroplasma eriocheiris]